MEVAINHVATPNEQTKMELRDRRCEFEWCLDVIATLNEMDTRIEAYRREHAFSAGAQYDYCHVPGDTTTASKYAAHDIRIGWFNDRERPFFRQQ